MGPMRVCNVAATSATAKAMNVKIDHSSQKLRPMSG